MVKNLKIDSELFLINSNETIYSLNKEEIFGSIYALSNWLITVKKTKKNDFILVILNNSPLFVIVDLAVHLSKNTLVPLFSNISIKDLQKILSEVNPKLIIIEDEHFEKYTSILNNYDVIKLSSLDKKKWFFLKKIEPLSSFIFNKYQKTIIYTSGTTGKPKGVVINYKSILHNVTNLINGCYIPKNKNVVSILPLNHIFERVFIYVYLFLGVNVGFILNRKNLLESIQNVKPYAFNCVPAILENLYNILNKSKETYVNQLGGNIHHLCCGSSKMDVDIAKNFFKNNIIVLEGYGMTEMSPMISYNRLNDFKIGSVGKPFDNTKVKINNYGEIMVKGKGLFEKYVGEKINHKGFINTKDIGFFDEDGYLHILGRNNELIKNKKGLFFDTKKIDLVLKNSFKNLKYTSIFLFENKVYSICLFNKNYSFSNFLDIYNKFKSLIEVNFKNEFKIDAFLLTSFKLSVENGFLTPTLKIKRNALFERFKNYFYTLKDFPMLTNCLIHILDQPYGYTKLLRCESLEEIESIFLSEIESITFKKKFKPENFSEFYSIVLTLPILKTQTDEKLILTGNNNICENEK